MSGGGALQGGMPYYKFVGNKALTAIENWAFGMKLAEYHSGYMLYSRKALETIPFEKLSALLRFRPGDDRTGACEGPADCRGGHSHDLRR